MAKDYTPWYMAGGAIVAIFGAIYVGKNLSPSAGTVNAAVPSTAEIDNNTATFNAEVSDLQVQSQIMNELNLTPQQGNTTGSTTNGSSS
ncbi:MAG: hypothetical protein ACRDFB_06405 [Rhabdochlamydiaceae bacterium]